MKKYNCIVVFDKDREHILFCKRMKDPYKGLFNFVGGKVEPGETGDEAAYRELEEETGISSEQIRLVHFMDITYYQQDFILELYVGQLSEVVELQQEVNPLVWLSVDEEFNCEERFAGEKNIGHIVKVAMKVI